MSKSIKDAFKLIDSHDIPLDVHAFQFVDEEDESKGVVGLNKSGGPVLLMSYEDYLELRKNSK